MVTPTEKIGRGIAKIEAAKSGANHYSNLIDLPKTTSELNRLAVRAKTLRDKLKAITDGVHAAVAKHRAEAEGHFANVGKQTNENGVTVDSLGANQRRKMVEDSVTAYRKNVALKVSEGDRLGILAELRTINQKLAAVSDMHNDPVSIVMTGTLGSKTRGEYSRDLQHAGPREIELAVKRALVNSDRDLLAACFSRLDSLDKRTRELVNVSKADAARHIVADQLQLGLQSLALADVSFNHALVLEDEVNGKRISSQRKIGLGVKKADLKKLGIDLDPESEANLDGKDKPKGPTLDDDSWQKNLNSKYPAVKPSEGTVIIGGGNG